jgi:hypothetical protein
VRAAIGRPAFRARPALRLATAFTLMLCVALTAHFAIVHHARQQRIDALRAEQQQLETELEAVKKLAPPEQPAIVLESPEGARVTLEVTPTPASRPLND